MKARTNKAQQRKQEQARLAEEKKTEITKDLADRIAVTQLVEKVVYLLAQNTFLKPGQTDLLKAQQFECALRLLNLEHYEDVVQERVHLDLCSNLRCPHPEVDPKSAKQQLSWQFEPK